MQTSINGSKHTDISKHTDTSKQTHKYTNMYVSIHTHAQKRAIHVRTHIHRESKHMLLYIGILHIKCEQVPQQTL